MCPYLDEYLLILSAAVCIVKMVNWHDPTVLEEDNFVVLKLNHVIAGIYIWETVFTAEFELDVLRGKRPYKRTIWLYLGTRYTGLLAFILYFIDIDTHIKIPCQVVGTTSVILRYATLEFALLLIALRVIAIWDRNIFVSSLAIGTWLVYLGLSIYNIVELRSSYDPSLETCNRVNLHKYLPNTVAQLVVDVVLLMSMLIGLRRFSHGSSTGLWQLLYQQCIIWIFLATISDVPILVCSSLSLLTTSIFTSTFFQVLQILDLNDPMIELFTNVTTSITSIASARMYRSLFQHALTTEYNMSTKLPEVSPGNPQHRTAIVRSSIRFATVTQSRPGNGTVTTSPVSVFTGTGDVHLESTPGTTTAESVNEGLNTEDNGGSEVI
ncbi:hypothetical protein BGW80DRAFT_868033 [Lactifluus volemus]|nr:hypothetical protein BGW80DRAFT_868033 [Lactifluus volemus]